MMPLVMPSRLVRRLVLVPLMLALIAGVVVVLPALVVVAAAASPFLPGRWRALRLLVLALVYLIMDLAVLVACFGLWLASGCGWRTRSPRFVDLHYGLMRWFLGRLVPVAQWAVQLRVEIEGPCPPASSGGPDRPLIVLSRHAGPGDSFLLVHHLLSTYRRRPRIIAKSTLQLDPALDVLGNRLPNAFIAPRPGADVVILDRIQALAAGLDPAGALLLFPEGGNFSRRRRLRSIRRLEELRMERQAAWARAMEHLIAPRPGGVLAALGTTPGADVVFVAHTGLAGLARVADVWRRLPVEQTVRARWWRVPAERVPREPDEQERWLYDWWGRLDAWIGARREERPA